MSNTRASDDRPTTYAEWKHCITQVCGIPLTPDYIEERLQVWRDPEHFETDRFRRLYGQAHLEQVIAWFELARREAEG